MPSQPSQANKALSAVGYSTIKVFATALALCFSFAIAAVVFSVEHVAAAEKKAEPLPAWFKKALKKEKRVRRSAKFETKDGFVSGRIPGKAIGKPEQGEGVWYVSSNLGAESPLECWFFVDQVNTGFAVNQMTDSILQLMGEQHGELLTRSVYGVDGDHLDGVPVLSTEWIYTVGTKKESQVGLLKMRAALVGEKTVICAHNYLGYKETFSKAFSELIHSLEFKKNATEQAPYYSSLYLSSLGGKRLGFTRTEFYLDEDGDTKTLTADVLLIPVDNATISSSDSAVVSYSTAQGELINAVAVDVENGELTTDLRLDYEEDRWAVKGTFQGKPLETSIESTSTLMSELGQNLEVLALQKQILADKNSAKAGAAMPSISMPLWVPDVDPTTFTDATVELKANANDGVLTFGPIAMDTVFDDFGEVEKGRYSLGGTTLEIERVWTQGRISDGAK